MLYFPTVALPIDVAVPDDFTLQYWPEQKLLNAGLVLGLIRMLVGSPGGGNQVSLEPDTTTSERYILIADRSCTLQRAMVSSGVTRCLLELSLSSNAPSTLKAQALNALTPIMLSSPENQALLSTLSLSPLIAVPADEEHPNGGFVRLPVRPATLALVASVIDGEGGMGARSVRSRAAGASVFEVSSGELMTMSLIGVLMGFFELSRRM